MFAGHGSGSPRKESTAAPSRAAGWTQSTETLTAADVMKPIERDVTTPEIVRRYRGAQNAGVGERTRPVHSPPIDANAVFGVKTVCDPDDSAAPLINPPKMSPFQEVMHRAREPVLKSTARARDHAAALASSGAVFGVTSETGGTAAECIAPEVPPEELEADEVARSTLYVKSHGSYGPGEQVIHGSAGKVDPTVVHGVRTPMDTSGSGVSKTLRWTSPAQPARVVTARQREFASGPPKPAAVLDPNTVFGVVTVPDGDSVDKLIRTAGPADDAAGLRDRVQGQLRPAGAACLGQFEEELAAADKSQTGAVPADLVRGLCGKYGLGLGSTLVQKMLDACAATADGGEGDSDGEAGAALVDREAVIGVLRPDVGFETKTTPMDRACGVATIRTDLKAPTFVSVTEKRNFGDQGDASQVLSPNTFTSRGLPERAVAGGRDKDEMRKIFDTAGLGSSHEFEEVWARAVELAGNEDAVSVQTLQEALM